MGKSNTQNLKSQANPKCKKSKIFYDWDFELAWDLGVGDCEYTFPVSEKYLHEGETLLCSRRSSLAVLILIVLRGVFETLIVGAIISVALAVTFILALETTLVLWMYIAIFVACLVVILFQRISIWREAEFRVTTERILISNPRAFFHAPLVTVKWPQYQECEVDHRGLLDVFFFARPIKIRYGTADARYEAKFPSLRYAEDIKHYLDKVDAAVRRNDLASLRPFVAKPRGKRDTINDQ